MIVVLTDPWVCIQTLYMTMVVCNNCVHYLLSVVCGSVSSKQFVLEGYTYSMLTVMLLNQLDARISAVTEGQRSHFVLSCMSE